MKNKYKIFWYDSENVVCEEYIDSATSEQDAIRQAHLKHPVNKPAPLCSAQKID